MNDELLMGVDIGTSYSKGVVTTFEGTIVARVERAHDVSMPHPGWAEHDADAVWRSTSAPSPGSWRTQPAANAYDAWLAGVVDEASDWSRITTTIEPDPATSEGYDQLYRSFRELYPATRSCTTSWRERGSASPAAGRTSRARGPGRA